MSVDTKLYVEITATCEQCRNEIEITDVSTCETHIDIEVKPHFCPDHSGSLAGYFLKEAEISHEERILKWLEMKKLEYELKHNI